MERITSSMQTFFTESLLLASVPAFLWRRLTREGIGEFRAFQRAHSRDDLLSLVDEAENNCADYDPERQARGYAALVALLVKREEPGEYRTRRFRCLKWAHMLRAIRDQKLVPVLTKSFDVAGDGND